MAINTQFKTNIINDLRVSSMGRRVGIKLIKIRYTHCKIGIDTQLNDPQPPLHP